MSPLVSAAGMAGMLALWGLAQAASAAGPSSRSGLGALPYADAAGTGVTFRVWAPNASAAGVKGQFNGWATTPLTLEGSSGLWSADLPQARAGQEFKFVINGNSDKRDPRSRRVVNSAGNSIIYAANAFDWGADAPVRPWKNDLVIYQMHVGTFNAEAWVPSSFDKVIERLDHVRDLGVSAVQVMPVNEFAADKSWGYNPADVFAIESALGGPDAFKRFVKTCHAKGLAVLVDVVHNHYGPSDLALWQFDGWSQNGKGGIYFYNDARSSTWWGETRPDYGRAEVRDFIKDQIRMFLNEYRADGFRWDSVFNIIYYNSGANQLPDGQSLLREINEEMHATHPGAIRIAEDHAFDFNMSFDGVWEVAFHDDIKWQVTRNSDAERNMNYLANRISGWPTFQRVIFSESHDAVGDLNGKKRLPRDIDSGNPTSIWARKRQLLAASVVLTSPGVPMIFQGQEMNEDWTFSAETALRWSLTNTFPGIVGAYRDLVHLRRNLWGGTQGLKGAGVNVHHRDDLNKVIGYIRWDQGGGVDDVVVVANFAVTRWTNNNYLVEFPSAGTWYTHFNSDSTNVAADFGGIGPTQVTASGNPPKAAVNMGMYSTLIFSRTPRPQAGEVALAPPNPSGCIPVEIAYTAAAGPLATATQVVMHLGVNGWQYAADYLMTNGAGPWRYTLQIPQDTAVLDFAFHDGATNGAIWDNNLGDDWHIAVTDCANLPSLAQVTPASPAGCIPVAVRYEERSGPLKNASNVVLYIGQNGWQGVVDLPLNETSPGLWEISYPIPADTWQLDFVFHNNGAGTNRLWDSNQGADWRVYVSECVAAQLAGVAITNPASDISVAETTDVYAVQGFAGADMAGALSWTNTWTAQGGQIPASSNWLVPALPVAEGVNLVRVSGTNSGVNLNESAHDAASNFIYTAGPSWTTGQQGGAGWGGAWQLGTSGSAGHFLATTSSVNLSLSSHGWGLWANSGGSAEALRPFAASLHVGDTVAVGLDNNWIEGGGSTGIGLQNRYGQNLFEFYFVGGGTNYILHDAAGPRATGLPWTGDGLRLFFTLISPTDFQLLVETQSFSGTLMPLSEAVLSRFRAWNFNAGGGFERNLYITDLSVTGSPLPSTTYSDEVTITRPFGPDSDQDGDGYTRWQEEFIGTSPIDALSYLPGITTADLRGVVRSSIPDTLPTRWYDFYYRTNLLLGGWVPLGQAVQGWGGPVSLVSTTFLDSIFYRTGVFAP